MISAPELSCRTDSSYKESALPAEFDRLVKDRTDYRAAWAARVKRTGLTNKALQLALEAAGAKGVLTSNWSSGWGVFRVFDGKTTKVPAAVLSCEDYGLVFRLAQNNQGPVLRVTAESQDLGEVPVFNTIATIPGTDRADEYVVLSAHFDSWDGSSGATDNGTGTVTMMETMRILKAVLPKPSRTILVGHWSGEEQGLNGSRAYMADHPKVVEGLQALFNQDNGTGRVVNMNAAGLMDGGAFLSDWLSKVPGEITGNFRSFGIPGSPAGSDRLRGCRRPACLGSLPGSTSHTRTPTGHLRQAGPERSAEQRDLTAMLTYLPGSRADARPSVMPSTARTGEQTTWPMRPAARCSRVHQVSQLQGASRRGRPPPTAPHSPKVCHAPRASLPLLCLHHRPSHTAGWRIVQAARPGKASLANGTNPGMRRRPRGQVELSARGSGPRPRPAERTAEIYRIKWKFGGGAADAGGRVLLDGVL
jgi:hypothetical protein